MQSCEKFPRICKAQRVNFRARIKRVKTVVSQKIGITPKANSTFAQITDQSDWGENAKSQKSYGGTFE